MKIYHNSRKPEYRTPFGAAPVSSEVSLAIDIDMGAVHEAGIEGTHPAESACSVESVRLMVWEGETLSPKYYAMQDEISFKQPEKQAERKLEKQAERMAEKQAERKFEKQAERKLEKQAERKLEKQPVKQEDMQISGEISGAQPVRYRVSFTTPDKGELLWYTFEIKYTEKGESHTVYYGNNHENLGGKGALYEYSPECYQITVYKPSEVPSWYRDGIVYQIFPDRFARDEDWRERCARANDSVNSRRSDIRRIIQDDWNREAYYNRDNTGKVVEWPLYGGSLKGIEEKLDYISSLGVTAIYLNPIFEASSNHRYDTGNYMKIDPALGTEEDFVSLTSAARERGIRIFLDGVFSHTGEDSIYFDRYGNYPCNDAEKHLLPFCHPEKNGLSDNDPAKNGSPDNDAAKNGSSDNDPAKSGSSNSEPADARDEESGSKDGCQLKGAWRNPDSPFRSWYRFDGREPCGYKSWWGVVDLPEVNEDDESYREYMLGENGVVANWLRLGASGWRLDVADELPDSFIEETRKRIKETDPEGLLIGEVWEDASNKISYGERRRYLLGDELEGTMNYPLRDILLDYINYTISSGRAADKLLSLEENYPKENFYGALNLIGSHDRERILTAMAAEQDYDSAARKVKLLSTLQYALPGVPCIYYGDEAGLTGHTDPSNRSGYPWGRENLDLGYHYRMLGLLYEEHPALKDGSFELLSGTNGISDDIFAFTRKGVDAAGTEETLLILTNRSYGSTDIDLSGIESLRGGYALELLKSRELALDENGSLGKIHMERLSALIISIRREKPEQEDLGRLAGVICHISSLGTPKLGKPAKEFVDYLASAGFSIWQVLPLNPAGLGDSPYSSTAAFAGEPSFVNRSELPFLTGFDEFRKANAYWLDDYIAYTVTREAQGLKPWYEWPEELKFAESSDILASLDKVQKARADELAGEQYYFAVQWAELKEYANSKGILLMGDLPMFMAADSADVWANKEIFRMDDFGVQKVHAGVPPDAFTGEGQDWGNPLYDWNLLKNDDYGWWMKRMRQCAERFDILRIDHFRGFSEYFAIPEGEGPAKGLWQHGPGIRFISMLRRMLREEGFGMKLLAEDLGHLDAGVKNLLKLSGLPGMDIWQFSSFEMMGMAKEKAAKRAFYTGTHDNNTLIGFIDGQHGGPSQDAEAVKHRQEEAFDTIRKLYESPACLAMMQMQDVLMLGEEARMNVPGIAEGNWKWKLAHGALEKAYPDAADRAAALKELAEKTGRAAALKELAEKTGRAAALKEAAEKTGLAAAQKESAEKTGRRN